MSDMITNNDKKNGKVIEDFENDEINTEDYQEIYNQKKKELLLENRRARVTTMAFHDWFVKTYKRDYKQSDKAIADAYHAGAVDEIENNEYILEDAELKMNHYKNKSLKLVDQVQILFSLLENVAKKYDFPDNLKKLVRKILNEQV